MVASVLNQVADLMEIEAVDFRTLAYRKAAHTVENLSEDIEDIRKEERLQELPGIGAKIAKKIEEIVDTGGSLEYLENLKKEFPVDYDALIAVEGLGPKSIKQLYNELGIKNLDDLEKNAKRHRIRRLKGMGETTERKILLNLEYARKSTGRKLLGHILPIAVKMKNELDRLDYVERVEIAGSIRRRKETVGDIDILVTTNQPLEVMAYFTGMDMVRDVVVSGPSKSTVRLKENGIDVDLRVFDDESFGSALMYFTGSKETNVALRRIAISKGLKLSEYGVFRGQKLVAGNTEEDVFKSFGMEYIEPELRENTGEVEAASLGKLPKILGYNDIVGDLQMHSEWSDGSRSILDMANEAQKLGYEYIAITDHSGSLRIANGMDEKTMLKQMKEIDNLKDEIDDIMILKGVEANIDSYGLLDVPDKILDGMDIVLAGIHSGFNQNSKELTRRILSAMENEYVNIIAHPTGRKIQERKAYELDLERIFDASKDTGTILEVNSHMNRLDLNDVNIKMAVEHGCKLAVNTDAHSPAQLKNIHLGIATARRGWAKKEDIINTLPLKRLFKHFNI
ncbi:DNA polymerase/3'-5' exonuclease PolX [Methanobacterium sp. SMA-27]|uniref:DNA polymerase/3'-5' exonuclease PolX n=1 Tax=Methanobacterium sp. SMA-27 TaxID=1495336 RepID=UPI000AF0DF77|nr:DNA polymerase/3'-5' exonuclease PolX [Methanobacterium sp. SMA-27]